MTRASSKGREATCPAAAARGGPARPWTTLSAHSANLLPVAGNSAPV